MTISDRLLAAVVVTVSAFLVIETVAALAAS